MREYRIALSLSGARSPRSALSPSLCSLLEVGALMALSPNRLPWLQVSPWLRAAAWGICWSSRRIGTSGSWCENGTLVED
jgi:hypothetical protein